MAHIPVGYKIVDGCAVVDETATGQIRATYRYYFEGKFQECKDGTSIQISKWRGSDQS